MLILFAWMIICDYFVRIYKNYANLWVINGVLTIKMFFATDRVVWVTGVDRPKRKSEKKSRFYDQRIIGYKNYRVKIYLAY